MALDQVEQKNIDLAQAERAPVTEQPGLGQEQIKAPEVSTAGRTPETTPNIGGTEKKISADASAGASPYQPLVDPTYQSYKKIESILEEDLGEIYNNLTPQEQKAFRIKGEEVAHSIFQLVYHKTKIKVKKIIKLIHNWLKTVPGINRFFLEQEAKIKADKIIQLAEKDKTIHF